MSGVSDVEECPRCKGKNFHVCMDWKPFATFDGYCVDCGLHIYTGIEVLRGKPLEDMRGAESECTGEYLTYPDVPKSVTENFDGEYNPTIVEGVDEGIQMG